MITKTNDCGQKTTIGEIRLKADTLMSHRILATGSWKSVTVPAGTVRYIRQETRCGLYHTIVFVQDGLAYETSKKTDDVNYGK